MEAAGTERRIGLLAVVASLVVVGIFWTIALPRTEYYKKYQREKKVKQALREIVPPAGTDVKIDVLYSRQKRIILMGTYVSDAHCAAVKTHYREEFTKHGFTYMGEINNSTPPNPSSTFSAREYDASLTCNETNTPRCLYTINFAWTNLHG
jgi:hypothetical protein